MKGYKGSIEKITIENDNFRKVLYTAKHSQLVVMSLKPNEEIGLEVHDDNDQFFRFEHGIGKVIIDKNEYEVKDGDVIVVPSGAQHNVINASDCDFLKFYTMYSPANHRDQIVHVTKEEAEKDDESFNGVTTE